MEGKIIGMEWAWRMDGGAGRVSRARRKCYCAIILALIEFIYNSLMQRPLCIFMDQTMG